MTKLGDSEIIKMTDEEIAEIASENREKIIESEDLVGHNLPNFPDLDFCLIGLDLDRGCLVYSLQRIVMFTAREFLKDSEIFGKEENESDEEHSERIVGEALQHYEKNIAGSLPYMGEHRPSVVTEF